jgi:putative tryptophan/tyrosine transport system substrate-binding protein
MNQREFIALLTTGLAVWSLTAQAQQSGKVWRVALIAHQHERVYEPLFYRLRELGHEEGRNLIVERRYAQGEADRFLEFADDMVRLNVDVSSLSQRQQAKPQREPLLPFRLSIRLPDPVGTGLVASLVRPGATLQDLRFSMRNSAPNVWKCSMRLYMGYRRGQFCGMQPTPLIYLRGKRQKMRLACWH